MKLFSRMILLHAALFFFTTLHAQKYITKKITFEILKGTWKAKDTRDFKIFGDKKLEFLSIDAHCYIKSEWTFDSDSTGYIVIKQSDKCAANTLKFSYQLMESPGYGGPTYKMLARFENGTTETLALTSADGEKEMKLGYNQPFVHGRDVDRSVWIFYALKKQ